MTHHKVGIELHHQFWLTKIGGDQHILSNNWSSCNNLDVVSTTCTAHRVELDISFSSNRCMNQGIEWGSKLAFKRQYSYFSSTVCFLKRVSPCFPIWTIIFWSISSLRISWDPPPQKKTVWHCFSPGFGINSDFRSGTILRVVVGCTTHFKHNIKLSSSELTWHPIFKLEIHLFCRAHFHVAMLVY